MRSCQIRAGLALLILVLTQSTPALGQTQEVTALVYSPDGVVVVSAHQDGTLRLRKWDRDEEFLRIPAHKGGAYGLALAPDGKVLASAGADLDVRLWRLDELRETRPGGAVTSFRDIAHPAGKIVAVAFAPDGRTLATAGYEGVVRLWEVPMGKLLSTFEKRSRITSLAYTPDGKKLAVATHARFDTPGIGGLSENQEIQVLDASTGKELHRLPHRGHRLAFTPDGRSLVSNGAYLKKTPKENQLILQFDSDVSAWNMRRGRAVFQHHETQQTMALSADGRLMASGWGSMLHLDGITHLDDKSRGIQVWEVATGKRILWRKAEWEDATAIAFSPAGTHLAVGTKRGSVEVHELAPKSWDAGAKLIRNEHEWERIWEVLGAADAVVAYQAGWLFSQGGDEAVAFLKGRLRQAPASDRVARLLTGLGSDDFEARQAAFQELQGMGSPVEPELWQALEGNLPLEVRRRVQAILDALPSIPDTEKLRDNRAAAALERSGSAAARACLEWLAEGADRAWLTQDARAALARLAKRETRPVIPDSLPK